MEGGKYARSSSFQGCENTDNLSCLHAVKSTCVHTVQCTVSFIVRVGINNSVLCTNVVFFRRGNRFTLCHMSTSRSGHLACCQSNSDLRTSNKFYRN